jgi:exopolyphosphatase/guanosine-5'-triphosphate,3'-diphosphate pyrophosphatase
MTVAAIDIGSNSVRLLVIGDDGSEIARATAVTALGMGLEETGSFDAGAYDVTIEAITRYASIIAEFAVDEVKAVATSASRDARNGAVLMADIGRLLGVEPVIIDGTREASLAFAGATRTLEMSGAKLVIDVGGGSTEFVYGVDVPSYGASVDMGSVRLTDRCFDRRPATEDQVRRARVEADTAFAPVTACGDPAVAIGVAGTFASLSAIALRLDVYEPDIVHGSTLDVSVVTALVEWLSKLSVAETAQIPSLDPARARVILGGAIVVERAFLHCGLEAVIVSDQGLLDGLAFEGSTP